MSQVKDEIIRLVQSLPENCTEEDVQYHLYIRTKIERGLKAIEDGEVVSEEEADQRIQAWLDSSGPIQP